MKSRFLIEQRLEEISKEAGRFDVRKIDQLSEKQVNYINGLAREKAGLLDQLDVYRRAQKMASYASPEEHGFANRNPSNDFGPTWSLPSTKSVIDHPIEQKAAEHGLAARQHIGPSMFHMSD